MINEDLLSEIEKMEAGTMTDAGATGIVGAHVQIGKKMDGESYVVRLKNKGVKKDLTVTSAESATAAATAIMIAMDRTRTCPVGPELQL